jgi:hypothetical protein
MSDSQKRRKGAGRLQGQLWSFKLHYYRDLQRFDSAAILARPFFWLTSSVGLSGVAKSRHREPRRHPDQHERPEREIAAVDAAAAESQSPREIPRGLFFWNRLHSGTPFRWVVLATKESCDYRQ